MANRAESAKKRMGIMTTVFMTFGVIGLGVLVVWMHT